MESVHYGNFQCRADGVGTLHFGKALGHDFLGLPGAQAGFVNELVHFVALEPPKEVQEVRLDHDSLDMLVAHDGDVVDFVVVKNFLDLHQAVLGVDGMQLGGHYR